MRSSTGAVVLVATAAVLLLTWPDGVAARAGATGGTTGGAAGGGAGVPSGGAGGGLGAATDGGGAGNASPDAVTAAQVPGGAVVTIPDIGGAASGASAPSAPSAPPTGTSGTAPPTAPAPDSKVLVLGSVFFPSNATQLGPDATRMLDGIATTYKGTAQQLEIVGHADARGSAQANLRLSAQRAEAVRSYLAANGIPPGNMRVSYDGARTPMARGVDPEANAQNRRVEVRVP